MLALNEFDVIDKHRGIIKLYAGGVKEPTVSFTQDHRILEQVQVSLVKASISSSAGGEFCSAVGTFQRDHVALRVHI